MAYFNYQSYKVYYHEIGDGTPLLILHGNTASSVMFYEIATKYTQDYKVILMDFLGCGKSDRVQKWAEHLWYDEAMQAICLLGKKKLVITALEVACQNQQFPKNVVLHSDRGSQYTSKINKTTSNQLS